MLLRLGLRVIFVLSRSAVSRLVVVRARWLISLAIALRIW